MLKVVAGRHGKSGSTTTFSSLSSWIREKMEEKGMDQAVKKNIAGFFQSGLKKLSGFENMDQELKKLPGAKNPEAF